MTKDHHRPINFSPSEAFLKRAAEIDDSCVSVGGTLIKAFEAGVINKAQCEEIKNGGRVPVGLVIATIQQEQEKSESQ